MTTVYKISGIDRRNLKKELCKLKRRKTMFWFCESIDEDLTNQNDSIKAKQSFNQLCLKIEEIEKQLKEL